MKQFISISGPINELAALCLNIYAGRGQIRNRVSIDQCPEVVALKKRVGDWEIDIIIGKHHKGALVTAVNEKPNSPVLNRSPIEKQIQLLKR